MTKKYYDPDTIVDYWEDRYVEWNKAPDVATLQAKDDWFEVRFQFLLPREWQGNRVLDFGCGNAMFSPALLRRFDAYYGCDTAATAKEIADENFGWIWRDDEPEGEDIAVWNYDLLQPDWTRLPYQDGWFDLAMSITVLQHQHPDRRVEMIQEIKRVLKPEGRYIGLEMQGNTQAADMPRFPVRDWIEAWLPFHIVHDQPEEFPEWSLDNVWYTLP